MHARSDQDSAGTLSILERSDEEDCRASEATWLPLTWRSLPSQQPPLHPKATEKGLSRSLRNKLPSPLVSAEPPLVPRATQYVEDHYPENLSLDQLADALCIDTFHLRQLLQRAGGMDFSDYLASVRIEKAKNLLLNPHYYFTEIASELGFESLSQFNQTFKRMIGESPHAYRARLPIQGRCEAQEA